MELKNLQTLITVVETGSFQKAALKLNYTQSTITIQMQALEKELDTQLFEKVGRTMKLTQTGQLVLNKAREVIEKAEELKSIASENSSMQGTLRVAMPESILVYQIQPILKKFRKLAPDVELALVSQNCYAIQEDIRQNKVDLALHYEVGGYTDAYITKVHKSFDLVLIGAPELKDKERDFITPHQVCEQPFLVYDRDALTLKLFHQYIAKKDIQLQKRVDMSSIEAVKRSVSSNIGISAVPRFTVEKELKKQTVIELPTEIDEKMVVISVYNKNKYMSPAMELFLRLVDTHFEK